MTIDFNLDHLAEVRLSGFSTVNYTFYSLSIIHSLERSRYVRKIPWREEWLSSLVFLPGEFHRQKSLAGYIPSGHKESDTTERLTLSTLP